MSEAPGGELTWRVSYGLFTWKSAGTLRKFSRKGSENTDSPGGPLLCPPAQEGFLAPGTSGLLSDRETVEGTEKNEVGLPAIAGAFDEKFSSGLLLAIFKTIIGVCSLAGFR